MSAYIKRGPCEGCDDARTERDTGCAICAKYELNFDECEEWLETQVVCEEWAPEAAALIRRQRDPEKRRVLALHWADGFADMLDLQGKGTEFNCEAFIASCGVALHEKVA